MSKQNKRYSKRGDDFDFGSEESKKSAGTGENREYTGTKKEKKADNTEKAGKVKKEANPSSVGNQIMTIVLITLAVFIAVCYAAGSGGSESVGAVGKTLSDILLGLFGGAGILIPFLLLNHALFWKRDVESGAYRYKFLFSISILLLTAISIHAVLAIINGTAVKDISLELSEIPKLYGDGKLYKGGGAIGGYLASLILKGLGKVGTAIFSALLIVILMTFMFGSTPSEIWRRFIFYFIRRRERTLADKAEKERMKREFEEKKKQRMNERPAGNTTGAGTEAGTNNGAGPRRTTYSMHNQKDGRKASGIDSDLFEDDIDVGYDGGRTEQPAAGEKPAGEKAHEQPDFFTDKAAGNYSGKYTEKPVERDVVLYGNDDSGKRTELSDIFDKPKDEEIARKVTVKKDAGTGDELASDAQLELKYAKKQEVTINLAPDDYKVAEKTPAKYEDDAEEAPVAENKKKKYVFPPIDMLPYDKQRVNVSQEELRENADKLVAALDSFHVRTHVVNIARGPVITRYELQLEQGTRVRSISNYIEDISYSLATSGIRVEGVIQGKSAIGIEVPNKNPQSVFLRELIDRDEFSQSQSVLFCGLGRAVAGDPVYLDLGTSKAPHLLIAGATGMGKSVCVNSLLISMLYKATPDDVRLILIDPKKVEFSIYKGLPHLLIPVITDSKKAAGALHWAVNEMERRYELIESVGVREILKYNEIARKKGLEVLPQIVIAIDEFADLMMTAPKDIEATVVRIAQKARAAGMHLIIGTQRPQVTVITGIIKANIPVRIALTVSSSIDARTILDNGGAEKLIGRGDMLYSAVGMMKPMRVQGAFVDDNSIESIVKFIIDNNGEQEYDDGVMSKIDREAEMLDKKDKRTDDDDGDDDDVKGESDPLLKPAVKLAVEKGKISTSLLQRNMSLGYGRAAKIIDIMESKGIVGPLNGSKPRDVLISYEDYLEMFVDD